MQKEKRKLSFKLIGFPLGHSLSPQLHKKLFALSGVNAEYDFFEIAPDKFDTQTDALRDLDGFNITIPYKRRILPLLSQIDARAQRCGAVNTVKCKDGELYGYNTDVEGFLRALDSVGITLGGRVLLCGAGGAARMMACEVLDQGCSLVIATRDGKNASAAQTELAGIFPNADITAGKLSEIDGHFDLLLNATPSGMYPNVNSCPVSLRVINGAATVFDAIYNPCETVLVKAARSNGAKAVGGLDMLIWQAIAAEEIWTGAHFDACCIDALHDDLTKLIASNFGENPENVL